ncbi:hypothetical protein THAOC_32403 [Thalassiosira oceanica]|uniref:Uncharacterized protein n=1 Tax=Thalassiosira oceanica TaxID=159749 RepID=K0R9B3_THAOC|nr:hypothetical protein THAOC_32403 [Thalassiosira oceanica]|eukprot:EJK48774.1 hypothetical protein THAOC_32403 [Thalassiosira oceanica]
MSTFCWTGSCIAFNKLPNHTISSQPKQPLSEIQSLQTNEPIGVNRLIIGPLDIHDIRTSAILATTFQQAPRTQQKERGQEQVGGNQTRRPRVDCQDQGLPVEKAESTTTNKCAVEDYNPRSVTTNKLATGDHTLTWMSRLQGCADPMEPRIVRTDEYMPR